MHLMERKLIAHAKLTSNHNTESIPFHKTPQWTKTKANKDNGQCLALADLVNKYNILNWPQHKKYNTCHKTSTVKEELNLHTLLSRVPWGLLAIFGLNAFGLRSKVASTASLLAASLSTLLKQFTQLQPSQYIPDAKHSQYLLKSIKCQLHMASYCSQ